MGGFGLPLPPDKQSAFANLLSGLGNYFGGFLQQPVQQPVAQSRITRTPIYNAPNFASWDKDKLGEYHPNTDQIMVRPSALQDTPYDRVNSPLIPHESAHSLFGKADLRPSAVVGAGGIPPEVQSQVDLTGPEFNPDRTLEQRRRMEWKQANEALAYSIGNPEATDFIEKVADQIEDPNLAQQLRRLHYNALATRKLER